MIVINFVQDIEHIIDFLFNNNRIFFVTVDMIECLLLIILLFIVDSLNGYYDTFVRHIINGIGYVSLLVFLYPLDLGEEITNYYTYKSIMLLIIFLFALLSIFFICASLHNRIKYGDLIPYVRDNIINPTSFYIIIVFSYISLIVLSFKLIPSKIPIDNNMYLFDTFNMIPLNIVQSLFVVLLFKVKDIINSKISQKEVDYYILYCRDNNDEELDRRNNLIRFQGQIIRNILLLDIFHRPNSNR